MKKCFLLLLYFNSLVGSAQTMVKDNFIKGTVLRYVNFPSLLVEPRNIDIWLPSDYDNSGRTKYAVLYMHDGQCLFTPATSFNGSEWRMDEVMDSLILNNQIRKTIIVGIWNTSKRFIEFNPEDPYNELDSLKKIKISCEYTGGSAANAYIDFIFSELKPFIDKSFPVKTDVKNTFMMGSDMGALLSLYALCRKSDQIKGIACLSTKWALSITDYNAGISKSYLSYFGRKLPNPRQHKIYFDYSSVSPDTLYETYQMLMDANCTENAYLLNKDFLSYKFEGAAHNIKAWSSRVAIPLKFLLY
ncbi:MAG: esterase [Bacteroidia bacterium]|nr:esterase [Bacteroidia bacterium]